MQACKNTYDKKTNKVANELNKLGIGKKTKYNSRKGNTPHKRHGLKMGVGGRGGRRETSLKNKLQWAASKKKRSQKNDLEYTYKMRLEKYIINL